MYPDLSYFFHDIFGTDVDNITSLVKTFGLFLGLALFAAGYVLYLELKRKTQEGIFPVEQAKQTIGEHVKPQEWVINTLLGFALGYKIVYIIQHYAEIQDPMSVIATGQGSGVGGMLGALLFLGMLYWEKHRNRLPTPQTRVIDVYPYERTGDITMIAGISGVIGAKLFAFLESAESFQSFLKDPIHELLSGSGLTIYGGLILGTIAVVWYARRRQWPLLHLADAVAPALMVGYAVGRLGCQFSGDGDWGIAAAPQPSWWFLPDWLWSYDYPNNVSNFVDARGVKYLHPGAEIIEGFKGRYCTRLNPAVYPTPLYESILSFGFAALLWRWRKMAWPAGTIMAIYLIMNGVERFFIEKIRVNDKLHALGLEFTQAELISVIFALVGIAGIFYLWRKK